jgi:hypothetical protein
LYKKILIWIRIWVGSGFSNSLDLDKGSAKHLDPDPDSVNPDPENCFKVNSAEVPIICTAPDPSLKKEESFRLRCAPHLS